MTALAEAGFAVLVPDMRGYGDSDKPPGTKGYDGRALAEEFRALVHEIGFGAGKSLTLVAHDMGAPPALLWAADHPEEISSLFYLEVPVMLSEVLRKTRSNEDWLDVVVASSVRSGCAGTAYRWQ